MKTIYKALAEFQQECPPIFKGTEGYGYKFASISEVLTVINPLLKKHGLGFTHLPMGNTLETIVFHIESGEEIKSVFDIPQGVKLAKMNEFQVMGSALTYLRRYALSSMLGLITDSDNDTKASNEEIKQEAKVAKVDSRIEQDLPILTKRVKALESKEEFSKIKKEYENKYGKYNIPKVLSDVMAKGFKEYEKHALESANMKEGE